jgi:hypothetical protein
MKALYPGSSRAFYHFHAADIVRLRVCTIDQQRPDRHVASNCMKAVLLGAEGLHFRITGPATSMSVCEGLERCG